MNKGLKLLSDYIFYKNYSQRKDNGELETWDESLDRIYSMHRNYLLYKRKDMDFFMPLLKRAKEYESRKKFLSSQRNRQWASPKFTEGTLKTPIRSYNCLKRTTEFITDKGVKSFIDFEHGDEVNVLSHTGVWRKAIVKCYGKQQLYKVTFRRKGGTQTVYATKDHRWILKDGKSTTNLSVGDILLSPPSQDPFYFDGSSIEEKLYWCYGFVYGDGTVANSKKIPNSLVRLCGTKKRFLNRFLELGFKSSTPMSAKGDPYVYTGTYLKTLPDPNIDSPELIKAFICGYLSADGEIDANRYGKFNTDYDSDSKYKSIQTSSEEAYEFLMKALPLAGYYVISVRDLTNQVTNYGVRGFTRFIKISPIDTQKDNTYKVISIEEDSYENVWCLEVEEDHSFVLPNGIVTGNCSSTYVDRVEVFGEIMYVALAGAGIGWSLHKGHIDKLPKVADKINITNTIYSIEDSCEGIAEAIHVLMRGIFSSGNIPTFDYGQIRPKGSLISGKFKAPGYEPTKKVIDKITEVAKGAQGRKLKSIELHTMLCTIIESVVTAGVRRGSAISLFDKDDIDMIRAKTGNWLKTNKEFAMANNSVIILFSEDVPFDYYLELFESIKEFGEPGIAKFIGYDYTGNPCFEIIQHPISPNKESGFDFCNLVEIAGENIESEEEFYTVCEIATDVATIQSLYTDFKFLSPASKDIAEHYRAIGVSITGLMGNPLFNDGKVLEKGAKIVTERNKYIAKRLGINYCRRCTTVKPSGTATILLEGACSGVHPAHDTKYIRRVRTNPLEEDWKYLKDTPLAKYENGEYIISFPIELESNKKTKVDFTAVEHLKYIGKVKHFWVNKGVSEFLDEPIVPNNVSATVEVDEDEWKITAAIMYCNSHLYGGVSFLPKFKGHYPNPPFTRLSTPEEEKEYNDILEYINTHNIDFRKVFRNKGTIDATDLTGMACGAGGCEIK